MNFPSIVKYSREKQGMSQEEMAHALQISFATINRWENGKIRPNKMTRSVFLNFAKDMELRREKCSKKIIRGNRNGSTK